MSSTSSAAAAPASSSAMAPLRRSTRSKRTSPYFSSRAANRSETSRHFSSPSQDDDGDVVNSDVPITERTIKGSSPKTSKNKSPIVSPTTPKSATKRKTSSPKKSKQKRNAKSPSKTRKKAKTKSTEPVERTRSFEPAWWGNVLTTSDTSNLHSHISTSKGTPTKATGTSSNQAYPPVHTLILGTHPSIKSLERSQMYGHDQNAFWYIAGDALGFRRSEAVSTKTGKPYVYFHEHLRHGTDKILEYPQQLERMVEKGFAIWDIVAECEREGSLDQDIKEDVANPIREFCEGTLIDGMRSEDLGIKRIVIANGTTGSKSFAKHFMDWFVDGKLYAASDEMSQKAFKSAMNKAKKANGDRLEEDISNGKLIEVVCLPGVSPAAASKTYLQKRNAWELGCYGPGLVDYKEWSKSRQLINTETTPSKPTKPRSPRKSASPTKTPPTRIISSDLAKLAPENEWVDLEVPAHELRPSSTLTNGQSFNWLVVDAESPARGGTVSDSFNNTPQKQSAWGTHDAKEWVGPLKNRVISIKETSSTTLFRVLHGPADGAKEELTSYFRLETPLAPLYKEWSKEDARLAKIAKAIPGVRILRQDPLECMFSFICSSNNNIPRIVKMLSSFRERYGSFMIDIPTWKDGVEHSLAIYSFPTLTSLRDATEDELRGMGLGYRAKYIIETRNLLAECGGDDFLLKLRTQKDSEAVQEELIKFSGIGRKVADCIALFSLDQDDAIPVDVHVQHIASRDYDPTVLGEAKSITPTIYKRVGKLFRDRFSRYPGWAHSLLFVAELPSFRGVLPVDVVREMDEWREHEQRKKREKKEEIKKAKQK